MSFKRQSNICHDHPPSLCPLKFKHLPQALGLGKEKGVVTELMAEEERLTIREGEGKRTLERHVNDPHLLCLCVISFLGNI